MAAYFSHDSYAAHVMDISMRNAVPVVDMVTSVIDCGIVVNPDSAINMVEGCIVDGIGNALYGQLKIKKWNTEQKNFDTYRMIRMHEIPKKIEVHFVKMIWILPAWENPLSSGIRCFGKCIISSDRQTVLPSAFF